MGPIEPSSKDSASILHRGRIKSQTAKVFIGHKGGDMQYNFEWDPVKAQLNADKHGVTFEEAAGVFKDSTA